MLASPAVYLWTGVSVIEATPMDLVYWLLPSVAASIMFMSIYSRNLIIPIVTDVTQLLSAVTAISNVLVGLFRPHGRLFKVTAKGVMRDRVTVQWGMMQPFLIIAAATVLGMILNATPLSALVGAEGYTVNMFWSAFNVAVIGLVCMCCVEIPRQRAHERFATTERGVVLWPGRAGAECRLRDISLGGARLTSDRWIAAQEAGLLLLGDGRLQVPFHVLRVQGEQMVVKFDDAPAVRRALIGRLFDGEYVKELEHVSVSRVLTTMMTRLLG
jgi:cellulose synthase (UDP-forming)